MNYWHAPVVDSAWPPGRHSCRELRRIRCAPKPPPAPAKAKSVIYLLMHGGVSHVDTFDPKPELTRHTGKPLSAELGENHQDQLHPRSYESHPPRQPLGVPSWRKERYFPSRICFRTCATMDDDRVLRGCYRRVFDHAPAIYLRNSGSQFPGRPCLGSWVTYGLGTENQNLPAFVVMSDGSTKSGPSGIQRRLSARRLSGDGLPQRRESRSSTEESPRRDRRSAAGHARLHRQDGPRCAAASPTIPLSNARIASYELAYRMQSSAPEAVDFTKETEATKKLYGIDEEFTDDFGRKCLLARRLVERGVRFIQIYSGTNVGEDWDDAHTDLVGSHARMAGKTDQPIAGLLRDLKARDAGFDAGRLGRGVRAHAAFAGQERPRSSPLRLHYVDGRWRHQRRPGARRHR